MLFNYANYAEIDGNWVAGGSLDNIASSRDEGPDEERGMVPEAKPAQGLRTGPEKCVFIYNTNHNKFRNNWFERCGIGVHFTAGSEGNEITGNAFVGNRNQVKYVGTRDLDWSKGGRGNYWSDNPAFDLNGDGIADTAYRPNDLVDRVLWTAPAAKVLINSPAVQVLRWAQAQFPALYPGRRRRYPSPDRAAAETISQPEPAMSVTVAVNGVEKSYGAVKALRNVSFDLGPGRLSALVGHNGAGKTTLIKLMLGLIHADRGAVRVLGRGSGGRRIFGAPAARLSAGECRIQRRPDRARNAGILCAAEADQARLGMAAARPRRPDGCRRSQGRDLFQGYAATSGSGPGAAGAAARAAAGRADNRARPRAAPDLLRNPERIAR